MPHRVNTKGDIGTAKKASDSYDADNIYLSEEGWVYRHFKTADKTMWWDEILVAGQVKPGMQIHGKFNSNCTLTNPLKLGTATPEKYQSGDAHFDIEYANLGPKDAPIAHVGDPDMPTVVVDPATKTYDENGSYRVPNYAQGIPTGWTSEGDPSDPSDPPQKPPYPGEDYVSENEYTINQTPLPPAGADSDPRHVNVGLFESGGGGTAAPQTVDNVSREGGDDNTPTPSPSPSPSPSPATPVAVEGYYPLYTLEADSDAHAGGDGTSHSHVLSGTTYYMPNGLTLGTDMFHGDYDQTGGASSGGGSSY